eukprot:Opistho-2@53443
MARSFAVATAVVACIVAVAFAFPSEYDEDTTVRVTLRVHSGTRDPTWMLNSTQTADLTTLLGTHYADPVATNRVVGYLGFVLSVGLAPRGIVVRGIPEVEKYLLATMPSGSVSDAAMQHVVDIISEYEAARRANTVCAAHGEECGSKRSACCGGFGCEVDASGKATCQPVDISLVAGAGDCSATVVGPDTVPVYDPSTDDAGCFISEQSENNCYDYGNDIATDTFAQPGRGSGHKWTANTCDAIQTAAVFDGLQWVGTTLPTDAPAKGHYVAMLIWPDTNFHWIRKDTTGWSHKPGGTAVRNTDNNGDAITDPSKSDFSPWTQFCGYFTTVPSNVTIN